MTTTAHAQDHLDPWGFGRGDANDSAPEPGGALPLPESQAVPAGEHMERRAVRPWSSRSRSAASASPTSPVPSSDETSGRPGPAASALPREMLGVLAVFGFVILAQAFYIGYSMVGAPGADGAGEILVSSHPKGLQVLVDGRLHGTTPLSARIPVGSHLVEVIGPLGMPEAFTADVAAGEQWAQHVELGGPAHQPATTSTLRIDTGEATAHVEIDGALIGATPVTHTALSPGAHLVRATFGRGSTVERTVNVAAGETLALVLEPPAARPGAAGPVSGWVRVEAPFPVQVFENGALVGSNDSERLMMGAGGHALELTNASLGYRVVVKAVVTPGKVTSLAVDAPRVPVHINAQPWAEVLVDGKVVGDTPLANLMLAIGTHQIVFRHPELGQRAETITVRASGTNRIGADLRK